MNECTFYKKYIIHSCASGAQVYVDQVRNFTCFYHERRANGLFGLLAQNSAQSRATLYKNDYSLKFLRLLTFERAFAMTRGRNNKTNAEALKQ